MKPGYFLYYALVLLAGLQPGSILAAPPAYNIQLGVVNEDFGSDGDDTYTQLTGSVKYAKGLSRNSVMNLNADIFSRTYNSDSDDKDSVGLLTEAIYSYIPTGGFSKPVYSAGLRLENESSDFIFNDFTKVSVFLADTIRFDDRTTFTVGVEFSKKDLNDRDTDIIGLFINTDLRINDRLIAYVNLKLQDEDNNVKASAISQSNGSSTAARDEFAAHHEGPSNSMATSLPGSDNSYFMLGANYFIDSHQSVDVSFERREYSLSNNQDLTSNLISLDYFYKF